MAEPKKKLSKTRTNLRRSKYLIGEQAVALCKNCQAPTRPHFVCAKCGFYNGESTRTQTPTKRIVLDEKN